jgi:phosphopentomutase
VNREVQIAKNGRMLIVVIDGLGIGSAPDSFRFNDAGANTFDLLSGAGSREASKSIQHLASLFGSMRLAATVLTPMCLGKGTTLGHWELFGMYGHFGSLTPLKLFGEELLALLKSILGYVPVWSMYHSNGAELINHVGQQSIDQGKLIAYTSDDAVLQLAACTDHYDIERLREEAAAISVALGEVAPLGRVITRPFIALNGEFKRTEARKDFHVKPKIAKLFHFLDKRRIGLNLYGKASEIFHWANYEKSASETRPELVLGLLKENATLPCLDVVNFPMVDDLLHELNIEKANHELKKVITFTLQAFETGLYDCVVITADHGCDIRINKTANTRESIPLILLSNQNRLLSAVKNLQFASEFPELIYEFFGR